MSPLRIGLDIGKALGPDDGLATSSRLLARSLLAAGGDHELHLCDLHHETLDVERARAVLGPLPANARLCPQVPAAADLDLFHGPAHRLPDQGPSRVVYTLHDLTFISHPRLHTLANRVDTLLATSRAVCSGARFIAVSEHTRRQAEVLLGLPPERVDVVPWAADPELGPGDPGAAFAEVRSRHGVDRPYLLSVGSLEPRKNLCRLVDAFAALPAAVRDRHLLVVVGGEGWRNRTIVERLERAIAAGWVVRPGRVSRADLAMLYRGAVALAYPSLAEGFGLPVLEAMACGCPVVTSGTSSLPEVAGDAALLVDPHDVTSLTSALERVLTDAGLRADLGRRGLERSRGYSWERTAEATLAVYRRACAG